MNLAELKTEVRARGFVHVGTDAAADLRIERWINQAYQNICEAFPWPFLETDETGPAPLTFTPDFRAILSVRNSVQGTRLYYVERRGLPPDLTTAGTPCLYYFEGQTLKVYPVGTDALDVRYLQIPPDMTGTDSPIIPTRYHDLIVDYAVLRGYKDTDEFERAVALKELCRADLYDMAASLMVRNHGEPDYIEMTAGF